MGNLADEASVGVRLELVPLMQVGGGEEGYEVGC